MVGRHPRAVVAVLAFLAGATIVFVALLGWRVPVAHGQLGASASVTVPLTGELAVAPLHPLAMYALRPGPRPRRPQGTFTLRNQTGGKLRLVLQANAPHGDLDRVLAVEVSVSGGTSVLRGTPAQLRLADFVMYMAPGQVRKLMVRAWIPASVRRGYVGRVDDLTLKLVPEPKRPVA